MVMQDQAWNGFAAGEWQRSIDVRSFIQKNWTPYLGDDAFLAGPTQRTKAVWKRCEELLLRELKDGILDVDTHRVSGIDNYAPGYIDRENEVIVGLQTDAPLKRIVNLYGGTRMAKSALEQYGYQLDPEIEAHFTEYRKTHNEGVFDAYPERTRAARHAGLLTGLPDAYGRGRIIGDYRRVALYGVDRLIEWKKRDLEELDGPMGEERIRLREEVSEQIRALGKMKDMASHYGVDLSRPAANAHDAIQALYMAYLAGIKENNGRPPLWAAPLPLWTSISSGTWRTGSSPRRRPRSWWTSSLSSCAWCAICAPRSTTSSSAATPPGSPSPSAA